MSSWGYKAVIISNDFVRFLAHSMTEIGKFISSPIHNTGSRRFWPLVHSNRLLRMAGTQKCLDILSLWVHVNLEDRTSFAPSAALLDVDAVQASLPMFLPSVYIEETYDFTRRSATTQKTCERQARQQMTMGKAVRKFIMPLISIRNFHMRSFIDSQ